MAGLLAGLLAPGLTAGPAAAQPGFGAPRYYEGGLQPHEIIRIVRRAGMSPLSAPARRGRNYVLIAYNRGEQVRVVVDAYEGEIVRVRPLIARRYGPPIYEPPPGVAALPPGAIEPDYDPRYGEVEPGYGIDPRGADPRYGVDPRYGAVDPGYGVGAPPRYSNIEPGYPGGEPPYGPPPMPRPGSLNGSRIKPNTPPRPKKPVPKTAARTTGVPGSATTTTTPSEPSNTPIPRPRPEIASSDASSSSSAPTGEQQPAANDKPSGPAAAGPAPVTAAKPVVPAKPATTIIPAEPLE
jgi:hypothetical protein